MTRVLPLTLLATVSVAVAGCGMFDTMGDEPQAAAITAPSPVFRPQIAEAAPVAQPGFETGMQRQRVAGSGVRQPAVSQETIRNVQQQLQAEGYEVGPIDGIYGPRTAQALREFQQEEGLDTTGQINVQTLAALGMTGDGQVAEQPAEAEGGPGGMQTQQEEAERGGQAGQQQEEDGAGQRQGGQGGGTQ